MDKIKKTQLRQELDNLSSHIFRIESTLEYRSFCDTATEESDIRKMLYKLRCDLGYIEGIVKGIPEEKETVNKCEYCGEEIGNKPNNNSCFLCWSEGFKSGD